MNLLGRRARIIEVPAATGFGTGLVAGTYASQALGGDCEAISSGEGEGDQRLNAGNNEPGQVANSVADPGAESGSGGSWSGTDGAGGGNWWDNSADVGGGNWSVDVGGGGG